MRWIDRFAAIAIVPLLLGACTDIRYRSEGKAPPAEATPFDRTVSYQIERAFYDDPPRCAVVLTTRNKAGDGKRNRTIEAAVARHLAYRLDRVIGPDRRDVMIRDLAVDLGSATGRKRFAAMARCDAAALIETEGLATTYALVWANATLKLTVRLMRLRDGVELWHASHEASRSEGSLPLSVVSIPVGAFSAGRFQSDTDVFPSMAEDVARRIMASLPDTRFIGTRYNASR